MSDPQQPGTPDESSGATPPPPPPAAPGYTPPAAPGYTPPAPPAPGYTPPAAPAAPGYQAPAAPGYTPPAAPGYTPPAAPGYTPPAAPGYQAPGVPGQVPPGYQPYAPAPAPGSAFNGFGLAALILGVFSLILAFVPFVNYGSGFFAVVGVVLGIVGLVMKRYRKPLALAGLIVSAVAAILTVVMAVIYTIGFAAAAQSSFGNLPDDFNSDSLGSTGSSHEVVITVDGDVSKADVSYSVYTSDDTDNVTSQPESLPFSKSYTATLGGTFDINTFSVTATDPKGGDGDVSCSITVDGTVVDEDTESGAYAFALCSWTGSDESDITPSDGSNG